MRLITWNCQGAFRKKADAILTLQPDILVVQECEPLEKLKFSPATPKPKYSYWYSSNGGKKGIGLFSYSDYKFKLLKNFNPEFRYVLPFKVTGNKKSFTLFAIWAMDNKENRNARYIGQVWFAINYYTHLLKGSAILVGDFNSNKIWDYKDRVGSHSDVVKMLAGKNIHSVYHKHFNMEQGEEKHPTFFLYKNETKSYHIDYCFVSADLFDTIQEVNIGAYENWKVHSDHSPLVVTFNL